MQPWLCPLNYLESQNSHIFFHGTSRFHAAWLCVLQWVYKSLLPSLFSVYPIFLLITSEVLQPLSHRNACYVFDPYSPIGYNKATYIPVDVSTTLCTMESGVPPKLHDSHDTSKCSTYHFGYETITDPC